MTERSQFEVLIVGGGLLGTTAALVLAHYGIKVVIVEKKSWSDTLLAKSARIDEETMLVLEQIGVLKDLLPLLHPLEGIQIVDKKARVLMQFNQTSKSDFAPLYGFYQPEIQAVLQKKARKNPLITIWDNREVETLEEQDNGSILAYLSTPKKLKYSHFTTDYVLVCNGQYSRIANFLGIAIQDYKYSNSVLCVDATSATAIEQPKFVQTIYDSEFPVTRIPHGAYRERWEFQIPTAQINDPAIHQKVRKLLEEWSKRPLEIQSSFVYSFETKILEQWQDGRIFIAGDAAHIMPPYLGLGLSAGIKDVANLAAKLSLVEQQKMPAMTLQKYQIERIDNVKYLIRLNLWVKRLFESSKLKWIRFFVPIIPKWLLTRTWDTSSLVRSGTLGSRLRGAGTVALLPLVINNKAKEAGLNSILGDYYTIIAMDSNPVDAIQVRYLEYLAKMETKFIRIIPSRKTFLEDHRVAESVYDQKGKVAVMMQEKKAAFLIVRPDRIVYEYCSNTQKLNAALAQLMISEPPYVVNKNDDDDE